MRVLIQICHACGQGHYPEALLCARCGGAEFNCAEPGKAKMIATTDIAYQVGGDPAESVWLALVETDAGVQIIARLTEAALDSDEVALSFSGKMLVATPG